MAALNYKQVKYCTNSADILYEIILARWAYEIKAASDANPPTREPDQPVLHIKETYER